MLKSTNSSSAEDYTSTSLQHQHKVFLDLMSTIKIDTGFKCLDIGCGGGNNTALLAEWVGENGLVMGIDPDAIRIQVAIEKFGHIKNLDFVIGKSINIPINEEYDVVVASVVMHWIPVAEKIVTYKRIFSALKPGGIFASSEVSQLSGEFARIFPFLPKEILNNLDNLISLIDIEKNRNIFTDIGFEIVCMEEVLHRNKIESLDVYFRWLDSSLHGSISSKEIYDENREAIGLEINDDGSVIHEIHHNKIIVRKPL